MDKKNLAASIRTAQHNRVLIPAPGGSYVILLFLTTSFSLIGFLLSLTGELVSLLAKAVLVSVIIELLASPVPDPAAKLGFGSCV
jgi:hypothetical protein